MNVICLPITFLQPRSLSKREGVRRVTDIALQTRAGYLSEISDKIPRRVARRRDGKDQNAVKSFDWL